MDDLLGKHSHLSDLNRAASEAALRHADALAAEEQAREAYASAHREFGRALAEARQREADAARPLTAHEQRVHATFA